MRIKVLLFLTLFLFLIGIWCCFGKWDRKIIINLNDTTDILIPHVANNINVWEMGNTYFEPNIEFPQYSPYKFVKWVQLMQCTGGSESRDLFYNPKDTSILEDYKFDGLVKNCRGILSLGAKPYLKLGNVPLKLSETPEFGVFNINTAPPKSYDQYYEYIKAIATCLVDSFGRDEVSSWRFGCMTEYENKDWFESLTCNPNDTFEAYCKLYDYTIQALIDVIGEEVTVGAHSMTVDEGFWKEERFIEHVANGINWATGKKGSKIDFISFSYYDQKPGVFKRGNLIKCAKHLQSVAKANGLNNIFLGVDEGVILNGLHPGKNKKALPTRKCGYTWQGAYDAYLYTQAVESGVDYISHWSFLSGGNSKGFPTISYHVANEISKMADFKLLEVQSNFIENDYSIVGILSGIKEDTLKLMAYNLGYDLYTNKSLNLEIELKLIFNNGEVEIEESIIDDDCNYFDEWFKDKQNYQIPDSVFSWSPDDACIEKYNLILDENTRNLFRIQREKYMSNSILKSHKRIEKVSNQIITFPLILKSNTVAFITITKSKDQTL